MGVAYTPELLARAEAYVARPLAGKRTPEGLGEIAAIYAAITGQAVGGCRQCQYSDYNRIISAYIRAANTFLNPTSMAPSAYTFAPGFENETFVHESYNKAVKADNITDADGEFIAKHMPHLVLKGGKAIATEPAAEEAPKPTLKADWQKRYQEVVGTEADKSLTIAELEKAIADKQAELDAARD